MGRLGIGFASYSLPLVRANHHLAVCRARKRAKHRSGVRSPTRAKLLARSRRKTKKRLWRFLFCGPAGDRTQDLILKRDLLYQLSYRPLLIGYTPSFSSLFIMVIFGPFHPLTKMPASAASVWASCLLKPAPSATNSLPKYTPTTKCLA